MSRNSKSNKDKSDPTQLSGRSSPSLSRVSNTQPGIKTMSHSSTQRTETKEEIVSNEIKQSVHGNEEILKMATHERITLHEQSVTQGVNRPDVVSAPDLTALNDNLGTRNGIHASLPKPKLLTNGTVKMEEITESNVMTEREETILIEQITTQATTEVTTFLSNFTSGISMSSPANGPLGAKIAGLIYDWFLTEFWPPYEKQIIEQLQTVTTSVSKSTAKMTQERYESRLKEVKTTYEKEKSDFKGTMRRALRAIWEEHNQRIETMQKKVTVSLAFSTMTESTKGWEFFEAKEFTEFMDMKDEAPPLYQAQISIAGNQICISH